MYTLKTLRRGLSTSYQDTGHEDTVPGFKEGKQTFKLVDLEVTQKSASKTVSC